MKSFYLIAFLAIISALSKAECYYTNFELELEVSLVDGSKFTSYGNIISCDFDMDSSESKNYLLKALSSQENESQLYLYRHRYSYCYPPMGVMGIDEEEWLQVYVLMDGISIEKSQISDLKLLSSERVSSTEGISTPLSLKDSSLFSQSALKHLYVEAYLCDHHISVFSANEEINLRINRIQSWLKHKKEPEPGSANGDRLDEQLWLLIEDLNRLKGVIVVSSCTD
jgi:hypothetical protein